MKNTLIVFGYNNTRIYDIERIKRYCVEQLQAELLLCKESITAQDQAITPYTLEINLDANDLPSIQAQIAVIDDYLLLHQLQPIACLPFSDKGVPLGSYYANSRHLTHDDCERSLACIDKYIFRQLEAKAETPPWYKKPFFKRIYSFTEAEEIVRDQRVPLFFKPTKEGNSRGCIEINTMTDLIINKPILDAYFAQGIIVEECIKGCDEYSFDGVNGCYIITEKKTSNGYYRVETQHILPSPLSAEHYQRLLEAGKIVAAIAGSNHGAVHNELFLNKATGEVYCVEPNRRPAGLKLWDWISQAYPGVDNWRSWLSWACGHAKPPVNLAHPNYYVGCRMLQAPRSGVVAEINHSGKINIEQRNEVVEMVLTKSIGSKVTALLKDNSDFIGYVVCKNACADTLRHLLDNTAREATALFVIH